MGLKSFFKLVADRGVLPSETDVGGFLAANPDHPAHVDLFERYEHLREKFPEWGMDLSSSHEAHPEGSLRVSRERISCQQTLALSSMAALFCDIGSDRMVHGYRDKVSLQSQGKDITQLKLKGTISTKNLVLNLLAYDTTQTKRQQQSDVDEEDASQELELSQGFLNTTCSEAAGEDLTDEDYANINWKRSSKLLENVELTFNEPGRCPSANTTTIVGCDPGIVNALTFSSLDPHNPNLRQTVKVRSRFLYLPVLWFNHLLNKRKREKGMIEVESAIPVFGRDTDRINEFGCASRVLRIQMASEKKMGPTKGSTSYVRLRGTASVEDAWDKGVLVVGLGSFESSKGVPSKHTAITRHLVTQRPTLCDSFLETVYPRSKYCRACKVFFDRDAVGAENIARIGLAQIERQERPAKYKPTEESPAPAAKRARR
ncbi:hypothetical protein BCR41DRAFT_420858 [Lobosporangium transversale]|uniref:Uncharacterized protein n=1 Tax=Lobosporangium transversale TaxID=64571 RepID=A0A1Y2GX90_9FUNG|nr:hypothetical protein BCR41DRAFT_420858 [Lobosporangium transversale]ORZ21957.1 hypothetical protein BCR41DRAFT_420858 [Lobosporangium transversale]|eukprot:XP_021883208.1 hypothetical protein BCR41DRAFT_420858 [Lobosporangium transversale]